MVSKRAKTVETILHERVSAIIRTDDQSVAADAMAAAVDGGIRIVEFTCTTPGVLELISQFAQRDGILVGAVRGR